MARAVVAGHPLVPAHRVAFLQVLPRLSPDAHQAYEEHLPERLESFPQPPEEDQDFVSLTIPGNVNTSVDYLRGLPWSHELRHDAESVFWLLVWWAIHLRSRKGKPNPHGRSQIRLKSYRFLVEVGLMKQDSRVYFLSALAKGGGWLDPEYRELESLFRKMANQLDGDLYWARYSGPEEMKGMKEPEYLHALQRIIFNFLMEHRTKPFMKLDKHALNWSLIAPTERGAGS